MILIVVFVENVFIGKVMKKEQIFAVIFTRVGSAYSNYTNKNFIVYR